MPNLIGVTNPVPSYDGATNNRTMHAPPRPSDTNIQNIPDPTRVGRSDARTDQQNATGRNPVRYDSNLQTFLNELRNAPDISEQFSTAIIWMRGLVDTPGLADGISEEMSAVLSMLKMDANQFREFFLNEMQSGSRFSGPLFDLLRAAYQKTDSSGVREAILNFAKRFASYSSSDHINTNLLRILNQLPDYMPASWHGELAELTAQLEQSLAEGDKNAALQILQRDIVTHLARYVERTHDMGKSRVLLSMLMLEIAKLENSTQEGLLAAFRQLAGYGDMLSRLNRIDDGALLQLIAQSNFNRAKEANRFGSKLARATAKALGGGLGVEMQEAFTEILRAFLLNESVYMPLRHSIIPLDWNGNMMYSEFWVDPDAEKDNHRNDPYSKMQFLFKMDIKSLGFLEMVLSSYREDVDLNIYAPDKVAKHSDIVSADISAILAEHGFSAPNVRVQQRTEPITLTQVFPNLFTGKGGVDVKI